jgi:hypothetical protein
MNQRERLLAIAAGGAIAVIGISTVYNRVKTSFTDKQNEIATLRDTQQANADIMDFGMEASDSLGAATEKSLPSNDVAAQLAYKAWLNSIVEKNALSKAEVRFTNIRETRAQNNTYDLLQFSTIGSGDLRQVVSFLYDFYSRDYLHRIRSFKLDRIPGERYQMKMTLTAEALSLAGADKNQPPPTTQSNILDGSVADYQSVIIGRNLFSPANESPVFAGSKKAEAYPGVPVDFTASAKDPEGSGKLKYSLVGEAPEGLSIDPSSGSVKWKSDELGDYEYTVAVKDDGLPAMAAEETFLISIVEKPDPPEVVVEKEYDKAKQAFVTAFLSGRKGPTVWVKSMLEGKTLKLVKGDQLEIGDVKGKIIEIGATFVELETDDRHWLIGMDESVADAYQRSMID